MVKKGTTGIYNILDYLKLNKGRKLSARQIAKKIGSYPNTVTHKLKKLSRVGLINDEEQRLHGLSYRKTNVYWYDDNEKA